MKLNVVVGYREYLCPKPVPAVHLLRLFRSLTPDPAIPGVGWASPEEDVPYHTFLYDGRSEADEGVELLLEYARDTSSARSTVFVLLPLEPFCDHGSGSPISDRRLRHFIRKATEALGPRAVRCTRLYLSQNTQAVLGRLRASSPSHRSSGSPAGKPGDGVPQPDALELASLLGGCTRDDLDVLEDVQRNYSHAVLELGERVVAGRKMFSGSGRAALVAECLEQNRLLIRPDLEPDAILSALEPGGELFELLSRPLPSVGFPWNRDGASAPSALGRWPWPSVS